MTKNAHQFTETSQAPFELRASALLALKEPAPKSKVLEVFKLYAAYEGGVCEVDLHAQLQAYSSIPGQPEKPLLVSPQAVKRRSMHTLEGRAALIHALAHIEFNAINLALDAIWRFPDMPEAYYASWLKVAKEEAEHFTLLSDHLQVLGYVYGDFSAHNSLWEMAEKTKHDLLARMALVPRTLEARGLDATPALRAKLAQAGDDAAAKILDIILRDEIGHVAIGNHWFNYLCQQCGLQPTAAYEDLAAQYGAPVLKGPFNLDARRQAGFTEDELALFGG